MYNFNNFLHKLFYEFEIEFPQTCIECQYILEFSGNKEIEELLLRYSKPNCKKERKETPLIKAAIQNKIEIVEKLLQDGIDDVEACDAEGKSALHHACLKGKINQAHVHVCLV